MLVHHAETGVVQVWTGRRLRSIEERFLLFRRALAQVRMVARGDDLLRPIDDLRAPRNGQTRQALGDDRNVTRSDLEQAVATERAACSALKILRLGPHHRTEVLISPLEDLPVVVRGHSGLGVYPARRRGISRCTNIARGQFAAGARRDPASPRVINCESKKRCGPCPPCGKKRGLWGGRALWSPPRDTPRSIHEQLCS